VAKGRMEQPPLKAYALGEGRLIGAVDGLP